jgi:Ca2+:H+ antiporter
MKLKWFRPRLDWLLVFIPVTVVLEFAFRDWHASLFIASCLAIIPLAGWMGKATEHLAARAGEGIGGLLNATFGNAAELIIALAALREGLHDVVKASLTGSIIGNILLVLGAAFFAGGLKRKTQSFHAGGARIQATMMTLATIGLILPAAFHWLAGSQGRAAEGDLSLEFAVVLLITYGLSLIFGLHTHKHFFAGHRGEAASVADEMRSAWPLSRSLLLLGGVTALVAWMSEIMVGSVEEAAHTLGLNSLFVGLVIVAIIGNAAEHSTAVLLAVKDRMDLSLGVAIGSSIQIALFVAPVLVVASLFLGPEPMNLVFTPAEVLSIFLAVVIANEIARDGESNWMEGVQLLAVYIMLCIVFYFLPETALRWSAVLR